MSTKLLENVGKGTELDKRTYIDGVVVEKVCNCGEVLTFDLGRDYLNYPIVGQPYSLSFYCEKCEEDFDDAVEVTISINLTIDDKVSDE